MTTFQTIGAVVGLVVATLVSLERAWFMARVFEHMLARVEVGAEADVTLNAYPGEHFAGKVEFLSPAVDAGLTTTLASDDFDGVGRPQQGAYDLGAFEQLAP